MGKFKEYLNKLLLFTAAVLLVMMTCLVVWQVFTRYVLKNPAAFTEELVRYILIWTSFIGAAYGFGNRQHVALTFLKGKVKGNFKFILQMVLDLIVILFVSVIMVRGGMAIVGNAMDIRTPVLQISKGFLYMIMPIGGIMIILYQLINVYESVVAIRKKDSSEEEQKYD